ncbi:MAG: HDIG domain-containing protein [Desulfobacula sp.]|jgi:uncharacterized protein|nr:HDIG domain-containing protein [Desulfobacula sp.]MBT6340803.1 HDIG domain-containing protein [Desulfobacula sp.]
MNVPSKKECFRLIKKMTMMDHIIDHSIMVSNVALFLSLELKKHSHAIDYRLATSAALLHDITKTRSFDTKENHSETGCRMLIELGYPEVGDVIRQHVILDSYRNNSSVSVQEIVNYSDKRILHDKVVSLNKRLEYIKVRYGTKIEFKDRIKIMWKNTLNLENKIFSQLDIKPDQLSACVSKKIKKEDWI